VAILRKKLDVENPNDESFFDTSNYKLKMDEEINTMDEGEYDGSPTRPRDTFIENLHSEINQVRQSKRVSTQGK